jgi:hypothetical protein
LPNDVDAAISSMFTTGAIDLRGTRVGGDLVARVLRAAPPRRTTDPSCRTSFSTRPS